VGFSPTPGDMFKIIDNQGSNPVQSWYDWNPIFRNALEGDLFQDESSTYTFQMSYVGGDGNDVVVTYIIPEPMTLSTVVLGGLGALLVRWWRRRFTI